MPVYDYQALQLNGKKTSGTLYADDRDELANRLREQQLFLTDCTEHRVEASRFRLNVKELADYCRQLGTMLTSGVSLVRCMDIICQGDLRPRTRKTLEQVFAQVRQGVALSTAMREQKGAFPEMLVNMFVAGESSGQLGPTAVKMSSHYDKEHRLNGKVQNAAMYPIILMVITVAVLIIVFTVVLPTFFKLFNDMELPAITQVMISISRFLTSYFLECMLVLVTLVVTAALLLRLQGVRYRLDRFKLSIPVVKKLLMTIYTARFARTLSSLYLSGMSLLDALGVARDTLGNLYLAKQFDQVITDVRRGDTLSQALVRVPNVDMKLSASVMIGEESGKLDVMLNSVADAYEYDAEAAVQRLTTMMEPIMIIIMAVIIGTVMLSVMLPIYQLYQNIG
ncbi:MAG: type II secretion system F family protein [Angelakisella sp.]